MIKILVIGMSQSADDRKAWSGTVYQSIQGLKRAGFNVEYLCALSKPNNSITQKLWFFYWFKIVARLLHYNTRTDESFYGIGWYKNTFKEYDFTPYDFVFVPTYISIVAALPKNIKPQIIHLVDATVDSLFNYYTEFSNLIFHNYWEAHIIGKKAFHRSDLIIASSDWCKQNAIQQYGCNAKKIEVIEFGANIDLKDIPAQPKQIDCKQHLNIYWSGVNWERKGGDVALECCEEMTRHGYDITFNITGMRELPESAKGLPFINNHGFLNKNNPEEYRRLIEIMSNQDIFLFPSKAECSSIALCEANGFGLPCFVYNTGGTGNYVVNGENGYMLPLSSDGKAFANRIIQSIQAKELNTLSEGAIKRYKEHLNWNVWSEKVKDALYRNH